MEIKYIGSKNSEIVQKYMMLNLHYKRESLKERLVIGLCLNIDMLFGYKLNYLNLFVKVI